MHLANDPPAYLVTALGTQPATRPGRERWRQTVTAIEDHRIRWNITDPDHPLGSEPAELLARHDRQRVLAMVDQCQRQQHPDRTAVRGLGLGISRAR